MSRDWLEWHSHYDRPGSPLVERAAIVHRDLRRALAEVPVGDDGRCQLVSICAGEGRDVIPILAGLDAANRVSAVLVELDPTLAARARRAATDLGLAGVDVRCIDAGSTDSYQDVTPAHVLLAVGVFGNITVDDMRRTVGVLPTLLVDGGIVIWSRAARHGRPERSAEIRSCFADHGFVELSFTATADGLFGIGMHQLVDRDPGLPRRPPPGQRIFTFA